jgi:hypothetical protein
MSFSSDYQNDHQKGQSIVHHVVRLGSKIAKPLTKRIRNHCRDLKSFDVHSSSLSVESIPQLITTSDDEKDSVVAPSDDEKDSVDEEIFQTLDQNEFFVECFLTNECSDVGFIVHFFNEDSTISVKIEELVTRLVRESSSKCRCLRVDARLAPLFTRKLGIDPEQPTVVAIRNGKLVDKASDFWPRTLRNVLERWILGSGILFQRERDNNDSFTNLMRD